MKSIVMASTALILVGQMSMPLSAAAVPVPITWLSVRIDLTEVRQARFHFDGIVTCPESAAHCFIYLLKFSANRSSTYSGAYSATADFHVSAAASSVHLVDTWVDNPLGRGPLPVGINLTEEIALSTHGEWVEYVMLSSEATQPEFQVVPNSAFLGTQSGSDRVRAVYAHEFNSVADVHVVAAAGIGYQLSVAAERGLVGLFYPWFGTPVHSGVAGYESSSGGEECNPIDLVVTNLASCYPFVFRGGPGNWSFYGAYRAGWRAATDQLWLVYLDQAL